MNPTRQSRTTHMYCWGLYWYFFTTCKNATGAMWTLHARVKPLICTAGVYIDIFSPLVRMPLGQCEPAHGSQTTHMYCRGLYWYFFTTCKNATGAMWTLHVAVKPLVHTAGVCIDIFSPLVRMPLGQCEPCTRQSNHSYILQGFILIFFHHL